jgi:hypothetical protein
VILPDSDTVKINGIVILLLELEATLPVMVKFATVQAKFLRFHFRYFHHCGLKNSFIGMICAKLDHNFNIFL